ncbi:MAG TPA: hypothetical protein VIW78_07250 [Burkholderiales bacterium]
MKHADFHDNRGATAESSEMPVVDVEVVVPLLDHSPGIVEEIFCERIALKPLRFRGKGCRLSRIPAAENTRKKSIRHLAINE